MVLANPSGGVDTLTEKGKHRKWGPGKHAPGDPAWAAGQRVLAEGKRHGDMGKEMRDSAGKEGAGCQVPGLNRMGVARQTFPLPTPHPPHLGPEGLRGWT